MSRPPPPSTPYPRTPSPIRRVHEKFRDKRNLFRIPDYESLSIRLRMIEEEEELIRGNFLEMSSLIEVCSEEEKEFYEFMGFTKEIEEREYEFEFNNNNNTSYYNIKPPEEFEDYIKQKRRYELKKGEFENVYEFKYIDKNEYLTNPEDAKDTEQCLCLKECNEHCLNRLMKIECVNCRLGRKCFNNCFEKKKWAKTEVKISGEKGRGLYLLQDVKRGQFVIEYCGEVLSYQHLEDRRSKEQRHQYFFNLSGNRTIDASIAGCEARFVNHSCDPNCEPQKWSVNGISRIGFFAIKDMKIGEELTFDYSFENFTEMATKCLCGAKNCRGMITPKNISLVANEKKNGKKYVVKNNQHDSLQTEQKNSKSLYNKLIKATRYTEICKMKNNPNFMLNRNLRRGICKRKAQIISLDLKIKKEKVQNEFSFLSPDERRKMIENYKNFEKKFIKPKRDKSKNGKKEEIEKDKEKDKEKEKEKKKKKKKKRKRKNKESKKKRKKRKMS